MTALPKNGWTAASLVPTWASGFQVGPRVAPAKATPINTASSTRQVLLGRILGRPQLGKPATESLLPEKQPNQNVAVNSFSTQGFSYPGIT